MNHPKNIAVIGCGYIGGEAAKIWQSRGLHVTGTTRTPARLEEIAKVGALTPDQADIKLDAFFQSDHGRNMFELANLVAPKGFPLTERNLMKLKEYIKESYRKIHKKIAPEIEFDSTMEPQFASSATPSASASPSSGSSPSSRRSSPRDEYLSEKTQVFDEIDQAIIDAQKIIINDDSIIQKSDNMNIDIDTMNIDTMIGDVHMKCKRPEILKSSKKIKRIKQH